MSLFQSKTDQELEKKMNSLLSKLDEQTPDTPEYDAILTAIEKIQKIRTLSQADRVSKDALLTVGANLLGIVAILSFERTHVIASKALAFVVKTRT